MWPIGISWTKGYMAETVNPDLTSSKIKVHGGPFFYLPIDFAIGIRRMRRFRIEMYAGFRPTPTWGIGYGNEGDGKIFTKLGQWLKKQGWGNLGFAFRIKRRY